MENRLEASMQSITLAHTPPHTFRSQIEAHIEVYIQLYALSSAIGTRLHTPPAFSTQLIKNICTTPLYLIENYYLRAIDQLVSFAYVCVCVCACVHVCECVWGI